MHKIYTFETTNQIFRGIIIIVYCIVVLLFEAWLGVTFQNTKLSLFLFVIFMLMGYLLYKYSLKLKENKIVFVNNGILHNNNLTSWGVVRNYRIESNSNNYIEAIRIKTCSGKNITLYFDTKKSQGKDDWNKLKTDLPLIMENNKNPIPNYYDTKVWGYVLLGIIIIAIALPVVLLLLKLAFRKLIPSLMIFYASLIPLLLTILHNRKKKNN